MRLSEQRLWDPANTFTRWQHPAIGRGPKFAVPEIIIVAIVFLVVDHITHFGL